MFGVPAQELTAILGFAIYGPALGRILGVTRVVPMASVGFAVATLVWTFLFWGALAFDIDWGLRALGVLALPTLGLVFLLFHRDRTKILEAVAISTMWSLIALFSKHFFGIGERFHEDSIQILANTLSVFQQGEVSSEVKRGLTYPILLSLGAQGQFLVSLTPLIFIHLVALGMWLGWEFFARRYSATTVLFAGGLLALVGVSSPMVRTQAFYLNSHTLVALGITIALFGSLTIVRDLEIRWTSLSLLSVGTVTASWGRFEGFLLSLLIILPICTSDLIQTNRDRLLMTAGVLAPVVAWFVWSTSVHAELPVPGDFLEIGVLLTAGILTPLLLASRMVWLRTRLVGMVIASLVVLVALTFSEQPSAAVYQARNLALGTGGWGFVAPGFVALIFFLRKAALDRVGRFILLSTALAILGTFAVKALDGGGAAMSFNDSVNRSWMHWISVFWMTSLLVVTDVVSRFFLVARVKRRNTVGSQVP